MLRLFRYLLKTIMVLIRVYRWFQRLKRRIVSWFSGKPAGTSQQAKATIIHQAPAKPTKKVFESDEGSYVDFEEVRSER